MRAKSSFTLLELLIIVVIIGVLATIAANRYFSVLEKARAKEAVGMLEVISAAQAKYAIEGNNNYSDNFDRLDMTLSDGALTKYFSIGLDASGSPANDINQRVSYMTRNNTLRLGGIGSYTVSVCENGKIYCTDGSAGDCVTVGLGSSAASCP